MTNTIDFILTTAAYELISKVLNGKTLNFTRIAIGDGFSYDINAAKGYKTIVNEVLSLGITKIETISLTSIKVISTFRNIDLQKEFYYREIGLYAQDPDTGEEVLYAYGNRNDAAEYITPAGSKIVTKQLVFIIIVGDSVNVTFNADTDVFALQEDMVSVQANIEQLQTNLRTAETNVSTLQTDVDQAKKNISTLQTNLGTANTNITNLQTGLSQTNTSVFTLQTNLGTAHTDITNLQTGINQTNTNVSTLQTNLGKANTNITTLQTDLGQAESDIAALQTSLGETNSNIEKAQTDITTLKTDVGKANTNITTLQTDLGKANTNISTLQTDTGQAKTNITNLQTNMGTAQSNITTLQTNLGTVQTKLTTLEGKISNNSGLSMPSGRYDNLEINMMTEYYAPANGYYYLQCEATSTGYLGLLNMVTDIRDSRPAPTVGTMITAKLEVRKGDVVGIEGGLSYNPINQMFRFYYAEGEPN